MEISGEKLNQYLLQYRTMPQSLIMLKRKSIRQKNSNFSLCEEKQEN